MPKNSQYVVKGQVVEEVRNEFQRNTALSDENTL